MVTSEIVGMVIFTEAESAFLRLDSKMSRKKRLSFKKLRQHCDREAEMSSAPWCDHTSSCERYLPSTPTALDEFSACRTRKRLHHRCNESQGQLLVALIIMLYTALRQRVLWYHRLRCSTSTTESPERFTFRSRSVQDTLRFEAYWNKGRKMFSYSRPDAVRHTYLNKKDGVEREKEKKRWKRVVRQRERKGKG